MLSLVAFGLRSVESISFANCSFEYIVFLLEMAFTIFILAGLTRIIHIVLNTDTECLRVNLIIRYRELSGLTRHASFQTMHELPCLFNHIIRVRVAGNYVY